jgi:hypothetical protein
MAACELLDDQCISPAREPNILETVLVLLINEQGEKEKGRDQFSWFVLSPEVLAGAERSC